MLPEVVYNIKKKLGWIFVEDHNSESMILKRGQTIGLVMSCIAILEEQGQTPAVCSEETQNITVTSNDTDTCIEGASRGNAEKAGQKTDSVQSVKNRLFYETKE